MTIVDEGQEAAVPATVRSRWTAMPCCCLLLFVWLFGCLFVWWLMFGI